MQYQLAAWQQAKRPEQVYWKFFRNDSDAIDMSVNGSVTPVKFYVEAPAAGVLYISRVNFVLIDGSQSPTKFGGLIAGDGTLTNGLIVEATESDGTTQIIDFLDGATIQQNTDFVWLAGTDNPITAAAGDDVLEIRWTLERGLGGDAPLVLGDGQRLQIVVQDNLTAITEFTAFAQGFIES